MGESIDKNEANGYNKNDEDDLEKITQVKTSHFKKNSHRYFTILKA